MLRRFVQIRQFLPSLESDEIDAITLSYSESPWVESLILLLQPLESVTKALLDESLTVSDSRALIEAVIEKFPKTPDCSTSSEEIVHSLTFENANVKIQRGNATALSRDEKSAVSNLVIKKWKTQENPMMAFILL